MKIKTESDFEICDDVDFDTGLSIDTGKYDKIVVDIFTIVVFVCMINRVI